MNKTDRDDVESLAAAMAFVAVLSTRPEVAAQLFPNAIRAAVKAGTA